MNGDPGARASGPAFPTLAPDDRRTLLQVARDCIQRYLLEGTFPNYLASSPSVLVRRAAFVSLRRRDTGRLRGCRGETAPRRPLVESVARMAIAAATDDERFAPVALEEVPDVTIEINALTALIPITPAEIEVGRHGLLIIARHGSGILLPEVPVAYGWDRDHYLEGLCRKAGLVAGAWRERGVALFGFETEAWGE